MIVGISKVGVFGNGKFFSEAMCKRLALRENLIFRLCHALSAGSFPKVQKLCRNLTNSEIEDLIEKAFSGVKVF